MERPQLQEQSQGEKRYPYKLSWIGLCGIFAGIGLANALVFLWLRTPGGVPPQLRTALLLGLLTAVSAAAITLVKRFLRPPFLTLRADGIYFPGRPKEGWRVAFADIKEIRLDPPFWGCRKISLKAQGHVWSRSETWWSISERMLPDKEAFDEIWLHILSRAAPPTIPGPRCRNVGRESEAHPAFRAKRKWWAVPTLHFLYK